MPSGHLSNPIYPHPKRGRPRAQDRRTLNGILYVLRTGCRWHDLPPEYGSPVTCWRRLDQWQMDGIWERIWRAFLSTLDKQGKLDWRWAFLEGSFVPAKKQLSLMSRVLNVRSPDLSMFDHRVQDDQELAHAGREGYFPGLARPTKAVVKGLADGVISAGGQNSHIEGSPHPGPSAPDSPLAPEAAAVSLVATQSAQFRKVGQQGDGHHPADPWDAAQQIVLFSPEGTLLQGAFQVIPQISQLLLQPADMVLDSPTHRFSRGPQPILLGSKHLDHLVAPGQEGGQFLSLGIRQRIERGSHRLSKVSQDLGIQPVSFGQPAGSSGEVSNLAGIDQGQGQSSTSQSCSHRHLESARGLQYHQFRVELSQSRDYLGDTWSIVSHAPSISSGTHGDIQLVFGDVYPYVRPFRFQCLPPYWPFLARYGLFWPRQLFGLFPERSWRPKLFDGLGGPGGERSASPLGQYSITIGPLSKIQGGQQIGLTRRGKGSKLMLAVEHQGVPIGGLVASAQPAEVKLAEPTLATVKVPRAKGRPRTRPKEAVVDKGYDNGPLLERLRRRGIKPSIPECGQWPGSC
jgi:transposase